MMKLDLTQTLADLVAIPSVNPMGHAPTPDCYEHRVTEYLERLFAEHGIATRRYPVEPQRENLVALIEGDPGPGQGGAILLLDAHQDTVPVDGMTISPFDPVIRDGRLYGRGSCDIKGGMVAMLGAAIRLDQEKPRPRPSLLVSCSVNEEYGFSGAKALERVWKGEEAIVPRIPDGAIVAEPTSLDVVVAHKGAVRWTMFAKGKAAHSSQPHLGENAIYRMARALLAIERYVQEELPRLPSHPLCGGPTLSVGLISGGISVNTVPAVCEIDIDRRVVPGEANTAALKHALDYLNRALGESGVEVFEHESPFLEGCSLSDEHNGFIASQLSAASQAVSGRGKKIGVPFGTNASTTSLLGVPSVVFGPGSIDQAHTADEWLPLAELEQASEILFQTMLHWRRPGM